MTVGTRLRRIIYQAVGFKISAKYSPRTLTKALLFRHHLTMMYPLGIVLFTYLFLFLISEDIIHEKT